MTPKWYCKKCKRIFYGWGVGYNCPNCGGVLEKVEEEK